MCVCVCGVRLGHYREGREHMGTIKTVGNYVTDTSQDFSMWPDGRSLRLINPDLLPAHGS